MNLFDLWTLINSTNLNSTQNNRCSVRGNTSKRFKVVFRGFKISPNFLKKTHKPDAKKLALRAEILMRNFQKMAQNLADSPNLKRRPGQEAVDFDPDQPRRARCEALRVPRTKLSALRGERGWQETQKRGTRTLASSGIGTKEVLDAAIKPLSAVAQHDGAHRPRHPIGLKTGPQDDENGPEDDLDHIFCNGASLLSPGPSAPHHRLGDAVGSTRRVDIPRASIARWA